MTTNTWNEKKESIRAAVTLAMRGFLPGRPEDRCVFWADETPNAADPRVILTATTLYEHIWARSEQLNEETLQLVGGDTSIMEFDLDVRVETIRQSGERSADTVATTLRKRMRELEVRAALLEGNVKTIGSTGPLRYLGRAGDDRKITMYVFTVPMRTELFEADPTTVGTVGSTEVSGTIRVNPGVEPPQNTAVEVTAP